MEDVYSYYRSPWQAWNLHVPGMRAILLHRIAHALRRKRVPLLPGLLAQIILLLHECNINASAELHPTVYLQHPTGVVIGQSSVVEAYVQIWSGVTLGGRGGRAVHDGNPTICQGARIGTGAKVLGPITVGRGAVVGANAVVLSNVPDDTTVVGIPARPLRSR
jgi:serine O-acetyltransferase